MNNLKTIILTLTILIFTGCQEVTLPAFKTYQLEINEQCCLTQAKQQRHKTIKIFEPITNRALNTTYIYYSTNKYLLEPYKLSKWSDYPTKMILDNISFNLNKLNLYDNVVTTHIDSKADYTLQSRLIDFRQNIVSKDKSYITLKINFYLTKKYKIISKTFNYKIECKTTDAYGAVEASNKAVQLLINDLAKWLESITKD